MVDSSVAEPEYAHKSILRGPVAIPHLRRTMVAMVRSKPAPEWWDGGVACTLIIAPAHLHGDWCASLKGCNHARVTGQWARRRMDAAVYVCTVRTWRTAPQPMPVWWRVIQDCTDPELRHSYSRRRNRGELIGHLIPAAVHAWCILPNHMSTVDTLYALDVLHRGRKQWMPWGHPHILRPTRRIGEYGQWLVDIQQWKLHIHAFEDQFAIGQVKVDTLTVQPLEYPKDPIAIPIMMIDLNRDRMATYNAWMVWVYANIIAQTDTTGAMVDGSILDLLWRLCSTRNCLALFPKSVVWDMQQATCLLPIHMNPKPHHEQWVQLHKAMWAPSRTDDIGLECIVCTMVLRETPLVVTECGHIVGACCIPRMVERGVLPPVYKCPECRRVVTLGQTAWIINTNPISPIHDDHACESKIAALVRHVHSKTQKVVLVVTHFKESIPCIGDDLQAKGFYVTYGKHRPLIARQCHHAHVTYAFELRALDLSMFCAAYIYDDGPNFEWLIDILIKNGLTPDNIISMRYRGTIEETALQSPPFQREEHILASMGH
jgi:hypothetical protein